MKKVLLIAVLGLLSIVAVQAAVTAPEGSSATPTVSTTDSPVWYTLMSSHMSDTNRQDRFLSWDGTTLQTVQFTGGMTADDITDAYLWQLVSAEDGTDSHVCLVSKYDGQVVTVPASATSSNNTLLTMSSAGAVWNLATSASTGQGDCADNQYVLDYTGIDGNAYLNAADSSHSYGVTVYSGGAHQASGWFFYEYTVTEEGGSEAGDALTVPYVKDFVADYADGLGEWTQYDGNGDGVVWAIIFNDMTAYGDIVYVFGAVCSLSGQHPTNDDYLISPLVSLEAGVTYAITVATSEYNSATSGIEVMYGKSLDASDYVSLGALPEYTTDGSTVTFTVAESGDYRIVLRDTAQGTYPNIASVGIDVATEGGEDGGETSAVVYEHTFNGSGSLGDWTAYNANSDESSNTWNYNSQRAAYCYDPQYQNDDYLISPELTLEAGKAYKVTVTFGRYTSDPDGSWGTTAYPHLALGYLTTLDASDYTAAGDFASVPSTTSSVTFSVPTSGTWRVALYDTSDPSAQNCIDAIVIEDMGEAVAPVPDPLTLPYIYDFSTEGLGDWTTVNNNGDSDVWEAIPGTGAQCYNDSNSSGTNDDYLISPLLAFQGGKTYSVSVTLHSNISFPEDCSIDIMYGATNDGAGLTSLGAVAMTAGGTTTYQLTVPDDVNYYIALHDMSGYRASVIVKSIDVAEYVEPTPDPLTLPYSYDFATGEFGDWAVVDNNNDGYTWTAISGTGAQCYLAATSGNNDDYLISPLLTFEAGKTYEVKIALAPNATFISDCSIDVLYGTTTDVAALTSLGAVTMTAGATTTLEITIPDGGNYYVALHETSLNRSTVSVQSIKVAEPEVEPEPEVTATLPYTVDWTTVESDLLDWTAVDANGDGETWRNGTNIAYEALMGAVTGSVATGNDDYLVSPTFTLEAGKTYEVTVVAGPYNSVANDLSTQVVYGSSTADVTTYALMGEISDFHSLVENKFTFTVEEAGTYKIALRDLSAGAGVQIASVSVAEYVEPEATATLPYTVDWTTVESDLLDWTAVDANGDGETWRNGTNIAYEALMGAVTGSVATGNDDYLVSPTFTLEAGKTYEVTVVAGPYNSVANDLSTQVVYGSSTADVTTYALMGEISDFHSLAENKFTFTVEEAGTYKIALRDLSTGAGVQIASVSVAEYVAPALPLPYTYDFAAEGLGDWITVNANGDAAEWTVIEGSGANLYLDASTGTNDDYLISPLLAFEAGKQYEVTVNLAGTVSGTCAVTVMYGTTDDATGYTSLGAVTMSGASTTLPISFEEAGNYRIALYNTSEWKSSVTIGSISVAEYVAPEPAPLTLPYSYDFATGEFGDWAVVDANNDGFTWTAINNSGAYLYLDATSGANDDYLISPVLAFEAGKQYEVTVTLAGTLPAAQVSHVAVMYGTTADGTGYTALGEVTMTQGATTVLPISFEEAGNYRIALYNTSEWKASVTIGSIKVAEPEVEPEPEVVEAVPYSYDFIANYTEGLGTWTQYNANGDDYTWNVSYLDLTASGDELYIYGAECLNSKSPTTNDDYLISPLISLEAGKQYEVTVTISDENLAKSGLTLMYGTTTDATDYAAIGEITDYTKGAANKLTFSVEEAGNYRVVLHDTSAAYNNPRIASVSVAEYVEPEATVSLPYTIDWTAVEDLDIWTAVDANGDASTWHIFNMGEDAMMGAVTNSVATGNDDYLVSPTFTLEAGKTYKVTVVAGPYNSVANALSTEVVFGSSTADVTTYTAMGAISDFSPAAANEFTFTVDATGTYKIALHDTSVAAGVQIASITIKENVEGMELPYTEDFTDGDGSEADWTTIDANGDEIAWGIIGDGGISLPTADVAQDDWLISPALVFEAGKSYIVSYTISVSGSLEPEMVDTYYGTAATVEGMVNLIANESVDPIAGTITRHYRVTPGAGTYYIGFHAVSPADNGTITVSVASVVESVGIIPVAPSDFTAVSDSEAKEVTLAWVNPTFDTESVALADNMTIVILCNGEVVDEMTGCVPGESETFTYSPSPFSGVVSYQVYAYVTEDMPGEPCDAVTVNLDNFTTDGNLYYTTEGGDFHASWGSHDINGGNSFVESYNDSWCINYCRPADDWLISDTAIVISPEYRYTIEVEVRSGINWPATLDFYIGNGNNVEAMTNLIYSIEAAGNGTIAYTSDQFTVDAEGEYNLGIHATEILTQTYIMKYKVYRFLPSGVENLVDNGKVYYYNNMLNVPADIVNVTIYDIQGRMVFNTAETGQVSLRGLGHGIYVVKATDTENSVQTFKIVK